MRCRGEEPLRSIRSDFVLSDALRFAQIRAVRDLFRDLKLRAQRTTRSLSPGGRLRAAMNAADVTIGIPWTIRAFGRAVAVNAAGCGVGAGRYAAHVRSTLGL